MRKISIIMILCSVALVCGGIYSVNTLKPLGNDSTFTEKTVVGDAKEAKGISINLKTFQQGRINYDTHLTYGEDGKLSYKTESKLSKKAVVYDDDWDIYEGITVDSALIDGVETEEYLNSDEELVATNKLEEKILELTPSDEEKDTYTKLNPRDYIKYYPLTFSYVAEENTFLYPFGKVDSDIIATQTENLNEDARKSLNDFFKIPIINEEKIGVKVYEHRNVMEGNIQKNVSTKFIGKDHFWFRSESTLSKDVFYFWFSNKTDKGKLVDTSLIPGGYGVYSVPVSQKTKFMDASKIKCIYRMDPKAEVLDVLVSKDSKHLYVTYVLDGICYIDNVVMQNGKCIQTIKGPNDPRGKKLNTEVLRDEWNHGSYGIVEDDAVLFQIDKIFYMFSVKEDGTLEKKVVANCSKIINKKDIKDFNIFNDHMSFIYDGKRLAVISEEKLTNAELKDKDLAPYEDDSCDFNLAIFGKDELKYYGVVKSSMTKSNRNISRILGEYFDGFYTGKKICINELGMTFGK